MPDYLRSRRPGGLFFFTVVTHKRRPFLMLPESRAALRSAIHTARLTAPFDIEAWVLLPDHLHCLWSLPDGDSDYPRRWSVIKAQFSRLMKQGLNAPDMLSTSRRRHRELGIWQRRYWEHQIRDDNDCSRHIDYIHYNPVKHGLVTRVVDWPYSTFHRFAANGIYPRDWGGVAETVEGGLYGE